MKAKSKLNISVKTILTFMFLVLFLNQNIYSQAWQWARTAGGSGTDAGRRICTDPSGNIIVAGSFASIAMNIGTVSINNAGNGDVFVAKFDPNGNYIWSQRIGSTDLESVGGICTDASGRVYVIGSFTSPSLVVGPFAVSNYTNTGIYPDAFVACFDSFGSIQWLRKYGGAYSDNGDGIIYSNAENALYIAGHYNSISMTVGTTTLTNTNSGGSYTDIFLAKLNNLGNPVWAITTGGANSSDYAYSLGLDASNNYPYLGGTFSPPSAATPTTQIGTAVLTTYGNQDLYIAKYSNNGVFQWARSCGSSSSSDYHSDLVVDASNNAYISGYYYGATLSFASSATTLPNSGQFDAFAAKYNPSGTLQWANRTLTGGTLNEDALGMAIDGNNNIYVAGSFAGTVVSTPAGNLTNSSPGASTDVYVVKMNSSGVTQWATSAQGAGYETGYGIAADALGNAYVTGAYNISGPTAFGTTTLNSAGGNDIFYAKIGCLTTNVISPLTVCQGNSATLTATGATSYTWNTGATGASLVVTPTVSGVYTATGSTGACIGTPGSASITLLPASVSAGPNLNLLCKQKSVISASCNPASPTSVAWLPASNLSSTTVLNPTVTANFSSQVYTVNVTLNNGCSKTSTINVSTYAQTPDICQVTVDSLSVNNEIYWEKTLYPQADSFIVYRETSSNVYTRIAGVSRTAFSMYADTNRSIGPANGDPNLTYYRYKLRIKDSCGNISPLSKWHETIFIQDQLNGNFNWNSYAIESATSTPVSIYNLKRRTPATGTETLVASTTGNLSNDPQYNSYWPLGVKWFVDAIGFNCNPTTKTMVLKTKTRSNQSNDKIFATGLNSLSSNSNNVSVYPNPTNSVMNIDLNNLTKTETTVELVNTLGQTIYSVKAQNQHLVINTESFAAGVYMVHIKQNDKVIAVKKAVIER